MIRLCGLMLLGASLLLARPAAAQQASPADFAGDWRSVQASVSDGSVELPADFLNTQIEADGAGFQIHWNTLSRTDGKLEPRALDTSFVPTDRPGVYALDAYQKKSFLGRLFADPATGNPLKGEILVWARIEAATLIVYGLSINPSGGYDLHRHAWTLTGDQGAVAQYVRQTEQPEPLIVEGQLERAGG